MKKELQEWQEQVKLLESQKFDLSKKFALLEECFKRDTELFRSETLKREETWEEERLGYENEIQRAKMQNEQSVEFVISIRKELVKLGISIEKKQEQYGGKNEENSSLGGNMSGNGGNNFVLMTVAESIKRVLETVNKRIDSFVYYSSGSLKRDQSTTDHHLHQQQ